MWWYEQLRPAFSLFHGAPPAFAASSARGTKSVPCRRVSCLCTSECAWALRSNSVFPWKCNAVLDTYCLNVYSLHTDRMQVPKGLCLLPGGKCLSARMLIPMRRLLSQHPRVQKAEGLATYHWTAICGVFSLPVAQLALHPCTG